MTGPLPNLKERSRGLAHTGVTNELVRAVNRLAPPIRNGQIETPPPWPIGAVPTLFKVTTIPADMAAGTGSGTGTGGTQKKACYVTANMVSDTSDAPKVYFVKVVYPHAVNDTFYALKPNGGAGWAYQNAWSSAKPAGTGSGTGTGSGSGTGSGTGETTPQKILWLEDQVTLVPFNVKLTSDGGSNTAPTYTVTTPDGSVSPATAWAPTRGRQFDSYGPVITPATNGVAGFADSGVFFITVTDETFQGTQMCAPSSGTGTGSGS